MKKYQIIYADPPWQVMAGSKQSRKERDSQASKPLTYPTMTLDEIKAMPVKDLCDKNCVLFLWTINKYLEQSYEVARSWGFKPSTMLVWDVFGNEVENSISLPNDQVDRAGRKP